jgi:hypothetical protein
MLNIKRYLLAGAAALVVVFVAGRAGAVPMVNFTITDDGNTETFSLPLNSTPNACGSDCFMCSGVSEIDDGSPLSDTSYILSPPSVSQYGVQGQNFKIENGSTAIFTGTVAISFLVSPIRDHAFFLSRRSSSVCSATTVGP